MEILLRLLGECPAMSPVPYEPSKFAFRAPFKESALTGWDLRPGKFRLLLGQRGRPSTISVNDDGSRVTGSQEPPPSSDARKILFIGDSFIFGEGLDDEETLPWHLQERLPSRQVLNYGVGGFSTCQSLYRLKQIEAMLHTEDIVIHGLSSFHEERNTADPRFDYWVALSSPSRRSFYPKCTLKNGRLERLDSTPWNILVPFTGRLVLSKVLTEAWLTVLSSKNQREQQNVTDALLKEMKSTAGRHSAQLLILFQELSPEDLIHYTELMKVEGIPFLDGSAVTHNQELKLPDGHPGPEMTKMWAEQLKQYILTMR